MATASHAPVFVGLPFYEPMPDPDAHLCPQRYGEEVVEQINEAHSLHFIQNILTNATEGYSHFIGNVFGVASGKGGYQGKPADVSSGC
ncbi:hypothetical protein [Polycladomyces subterraneus]|uniref:Uncharacterized protein n=1 Tax=Polycladomyces subterraneus TaxID=1016997 RepID=A0ABT8IQT8_9BACL|nr:hypothetical protein [Polycladomyces subterraneus]MDN4595170.1 hypothetical protein [Polycladomyces subterraneus]